MPKYSVTLDNLPTLADCGNLSPVLRGNWQCKRGASDPVEIAKRYTMRKRQLAIVKIAFFPTTALLWLIFATITYLVSRNQDAFANVTFVGTLLFAVGAVLAGVTLFTAEPNPEYSVRYDPWTAERFCKYHTLLCNLLDKSPYELAHMSNEGLTIAARDALTGLALHVLFVQSQNASVPAGAWSDRKGKVINALKNGFDLVKGLGLIPDDEEYGPTFDKAKKRMSAQCAA